MKTKVHFQLFLFLINRTFLKKKHHSDGQFFIQLISFPKLIYITIMKNHYKGPINHQQLKILTSLHLEG